MAHVAKYPRSSTGHLCSHFERKKNENGEYIKFKNQDIDSTRTPENYNLAPDRGIGQEGIIRQRLSDSDVHMQQRKDVNVMCSWVVTLPQGLEIGEHREFMELTYKFLCDRYGGEQNVISAYVHMDEARPHMHFAFLPIVEDKKKGGYKVSAKEAIGRYDLQTFHDDLSVRMTSHYGRDIGILNDATKDGNKSIEELKSGEAEKTVVELRHEFTQLEPKVKELRQEYEVYREYQVQDAPTIEAKPSPFNKGMVLVKADDLERVVKAAEAYRMNRSEVMRTRNTQKALSEREKVIVDREARIERRESVLQGRERKAEDVLRRFKNLAAARGSYDALERQRDDLLEKNKALVGEITPLRAALAKAEKVAEEWRDRFEVVSNQLVGVVQSALAMNISHGNGPALNNRQHGILAAISKTVGRFFLSQGDEERAGRVAFISENAKEAPEVLRVRGKDGQEI